MQLVATWKAKPARKYAAIGAFPGVDPMAVCKLTRNPSLFAVAQEVGPKANITRNTSLIAASHTGSPEANITRNPSLKNIISCERS